jgi:phosphoadenosine phosphosulfate reductase
MNKTLNFERIVRLDTPDPKIDESSSPIELIEWATEQFADQRCVMTTAFGMEGCALIDMYSKYTTSLKVAYIDTGFFFPETNQLIQKMAQKYSHIEFEKWESPISIVKQGESYGEALWKDNPNLCCHIRKVVPMKMNIQPYQLWITGLRKTQSEHRANTPVLTWDWKYQILKFCPLANWTRAEVWKYVQENDVPFNQLHQQGFPSIGCFHCTKAVPGSTPENDSREGRWEGKEKTECGLHYSI